MTIYTKIAAITALTLLSSVNPAFANESAANSAAVTTKASAVVSAKQFKAYKSDTSFLIRSKHKVRAIDDVNIETSEYNADDGNIDLARYYPVNEDSTAFIGKPTRMKRGFVAYQKSGLSTEGRITKPMKSMAAIGIRSKF